MYEIGGILLHNLDAHFIIGVHSDSVWVFFNTF